MKVIQPGEGKVEAGHIFIFTGSIDGFLHCLEGLAAGAREFDGRYVYILRLIRGSSQNLLGGWQD